MLKNVLLIAVALILSVTAYSQSGTLKGRVLDGSNGEGIAFANVSIELNGTVITGGMTDFDGNFTIKPVPAGVYDVKASYVGYQSLQLKGLRVLAGKITFQDFKLATSVQNLQEVEVREYKVPLISKDQTQSGGSVTSEEIAKMPGRSAESVAVTVGGVYSENGSVTSIRGAREEATVYYIDGVKVRGSNAMPKTATAQVDVITGGIPAKYGDVTGGIISVTTKEPSREMFGGIELVTSKFLDPYNYNLAELMITGPLASRKSPDPYDSTKIKKDIIAGYFLSGSFNYVSDNYPSAVGVWKAKDGVIDDLLSVPYRSNDQGNGTLLNGEYLTIDDFEKIKARQDAEDKQFNVSGKVDFKPSRNINLTAGGTYSYQKARLYDYDNMLFNTQNNGTYTGITWRTYLRLIQKFGNNEDKESANNVIKNAFYSIQVDFEKVNTLREDDRHGDDLFKYGYVGKFNTTTVNSYSWDTLAGYETGLWVHDGFRDIRYDFDASDINPDLASYTTFFYGLFPEGNSLNDIMYSNATMVQAGGGLLNGQNPKVIFNSGKDANSTFASPGTQYGTYNKSDASQFRISASGSADIKDHEISIGFEFEQRNESAFSIVPMALWQLARNNINSHILELDYTNPNFIYDELNGVFLDTVKYDRSYNAVSQTQFDVMMREHLGLDKTSLEWIDIDSYDPSELKLDYFSADELFGAGSNSVVSYYGFDHHGNKLSSKPSLNDFFTAKDDNGRFKREIAAFQPIYAAAYIQDKFAFKDLIFNVGVRIDRFDANQMVLKDPYSIYETKKLSEVDGALNPNGYHPSNIPDNAVVYGDGVSNPSEILGYRVGTDPASVRWYDANGTIVNDPKSIAHTTGLSPILLNANEGLNANGFTDYTPQINVMPRVSFSFPISDVALFFAHYDILTKRPIGAVRLNPFEYLFLNSMGTNPINNPNLQPEKTIDYELGFQQKISNTSALKLAAFYREMRDMAQVQMIYGAYPNDYMTYTNIDFGTVKGVTLSYDMRRTGNVTLRASYTLQFANGTGSNFETNRALISGGQPNLRTTIPLDFDQRHAVTGSLDYRYGSGRDYNGPKIAGKDILQNTGANFVVNFGTGSPYSKRNLDDNTLQGAINGSRKPSKTTINLRLDRDIELKFGDKEDGNGKKKAFLNIYLEINNLLNTLNILNVYETTGNADDDGWLVNSKNQVAINSQNSPESYKNYYSMYYNSPYNYTLPRTIRLGAVINF